MLKKDEMDGNVIISFIDILMQNEKQTYVLHEQLKALLSTGAFSVVVSMAFVISVFYLQLDLQLHSMNIWFVVMIVIHSIRFLLHFVLVKFPASHDQAVKYHVNLIRLMVILTAILWGCNGLIVLMLENITQEELFAQLMIISYVLAGVSVGAAMNYMSERVCCLAYLIFALFPFVLGCYFLSQHDAISIKFAAVGFVSAVFFLFLILKQNRQFVDAIKLQYEVAQHQAEIQKLAFIDQLTGLPNRRLLEERLGRALINSERVNAKSALIYMDLDKFKNLNDLYGHDMGDSLLTQVAKRLQESLRKSDTVSRFGGDEFVLLLENLNADYARAIQEVENLINLILANLRKPYQLIDITYSSTPSIGIAMLGEHGRTQQDLLKHADIAMYQAKSQGGNQAVFYEVNLQVD